MMLYYSYVVGLFLARTLPVKICYALAGFFARIYRLFAARDREAIRANLKVVLGKEVDDHELDKYVAVLFRNFAKYLADFLKFPKFTKEEVYHRVEVKGVEHLDRAIAGGKGVLLVSLHLGNWEMGGAVIAALGYKLNAIALQHGNKRINDLFVGQRAINGMKVIHPGVSLKHCFKVLRNNELLAIVGDKDYTSNGEYIDFFGKKALLPKGPAFFSMRTGAPIVITVLARKEDDNFRLTFEAPIEPETTGAADRDLRATMAKYIPLMEQHIRETPDQWYAFRRIWEQEPTIR